MSDTPATPTRESLMGAAFDAHIKDITDWHAKYSAVVHQRDALVKALEGLDAFFDFGEKLSDKEACVVAYSPELQAAFEAAHEALKEYTQL